MYFKRLRYYHLTIETNSREDYFAISDFDYEKLIRLFSRYIANTFYVLSFCFLPQNYECVLQVKDRENRQRLGKIDLALTYYLSDTIRKLHIAYARYFNYRYNRKGSLFREKPKAIELKDKSEVVKSILSVHNLPIKFRLTSNIGDWKWSSYRNYLNALDYPRISKKRVLKIFGGEDIFFEKHRDYCLKI